MDYTGQDQSVIECVPMSMLFAAACEAGPYLQGKVMPGRISAIDWAASPLGAMETWPEALKGAVRVMLCAPAPMGIIVGDQGWLLFNDPLREVFGTMEGEPLGRSIFDILPQAETFYRNVIARCASGEAPRFEDQPLRLNRSGVATKAWFDLAFTPLIEADGRYLGAVILVTETTARLGVERRLRRSERDLQDALRLAEVVAQELDHRIKNIFSMADALVSLSVRDHPQMRDFAEELHQRFHALGRAHALIHGRGPAFGRPAAVCLHALLGALLEPYAGAARSRVIVAGDDPQIDTAAVTPLTLVFHELATNAAKYGALAREGGALRLDIRTIGADLAVRWKEIGMTGSPPVANGGGFGSRMLTTVVEGQFGGRLSRRQEDDGLCIDIVVPLDRLQGRPPGQAF